MMEDIKIQMQLYSLEGINKATNDIEKSQRKKLILPVTRISLMRFEDETRNTLERTLKDIKKRIKDDIACKKLFEKLTGNNNLWATISEQIFLQWHYSTN